MEAKNGAVKLEGLEHLSEVVGKARNGAVKLLNCCAQIVAVEAHNGAVHLEGCTGGGVRIQNRNGAVRLENCDFQQLLDLSSQNGPVQAREVGPAACIRMDNKNGAVTAVIRGREDDYRIDTHTINGRCVPASCRRPQATKTLYAHTINGRVDVSFHQ